MVSTASFSTSPSEARGSPLPRRLTNVQLYYIKASLLNQCSIALRANYLRLARFAAHECLTAAGKRFIDKRMQNELHEIVESIHDSYQRFGAINHIGGPGLPSRSSVIAIMHDLESLIFPGYRADEQLHENNLRHTIGEKTCRLCRSLTTEIQKSLRFKHANDLELHGSSEVDYSWCAAEQFAFDLLGKLPDIRRRVRLDVEAAFLGDPAGKSHEEVILSYPGVEAILVHRVAHELWNAGIPLIPRMMSEQIHGQTGIDIHPGATIGDYFFIDHATGVVIGETTIIGRNVKIYQGVTLGALSVKKEAADKKRHPTIEDDVTIYAGATILGGKTVIGRNSIIGGNVWLTSSVPAGSTIYNPPVDHIRRQKHAELPDYQI